MLAKQEALLLRTLNHPNLVQFLGVSVEGGLLQGGDRNARGLAASLVHDLNPSLAARMLSSQ